MANCVCGCGKKVKFGRGYLNTRSSELKVLSDFGALVRERMTQREIPNTPTEELEKVRNHLGALATFCVHYSVSLHGYSIGQLEESEVSQVLQSRALVFEHESSLIDTALYVACFCLFNGSLSRDEFVSRVGEFSKAQNVKAKMTLSKLRSMCTPEENLAIPNV